MFSDYGKPLQRSLVTMSAELHFLQYFCKITTGNSFILKNNRTETISSDRTVDLQTSDDFTGENLLIDQETDFSNGSVAVHFLFAGRGRKLVISFEQLDGSF